MRRIAARSPSPLALLAPTLGAVAVAFGLAQCGGSGSGSSGSDAGDATADSTAKEASPGDSTTPDSDSSKAKDGGSEAAVADAGDAGEGSDAGDAGEAGDANASDVVEAGIPCDAAAACSGSMQCCSSWCVDVAHDPRNCGGCGNACTATQFCTGTTCDDAVFTNLCASHAVTVIDDPYPPDNEAGATLGQAVASSCSPDGGVAVAIVPQTQAGVLIPADGGWRPNTGVGTTMVVGGGESGQLSVQYLDHAGLSPVYLVNDGTTSQIVERSTGLAVVTAQDSALTGGQHDYFALQLAVEPQSGTLCLLGWGIYGAGTVAAGYYGSQVFVPGYASYPGSWYVYQWDDTNNDMTPDSGDAFTFVASGP